MLQADLFPVVGARASGSFGSEAIGAVDYVTGLFNRADIVAAILDRYLPQDPGGKAEALVAASGPVRFGGGYGPMANYRFLAFTRAAVSDIATGGSVLALETLGELTRRFTAEFDIRVLIRRDFNTTYGRLVDWVEHPDQHVRRLVSEGSRPRLPWATHLDGFKRDPRDLAVLLDSLKRDPSPYVRLSVGNCVADILKDNPEIGYGLLEDWMQHADDRIRWIVRRAVRYSADRGDATALRLQSMASA